MPALPMLLAAGVALSSLAATRPHPSPPRVIIDTDLRSDVDDAGTLAMVNALADREECELVGVIASQTGPAIVSAIDAINTWYGRGHVPVGLSPIDDQRFRDPYAPTIGDPQQYPSTQRNDTAPESTALYRRLLNQAPDDSVVIVVIGAQTCVRLLLESPADAEGDASINRTGQELVRDKVRLLAIMGGNFADPDAQEHNINLDRPAADAIANHWPTDILYCGFEIGRAVRTGGRMQDPASNPVAKAYELYPGAGGRGKIGSSPSYDQATAYAAIRGVNHGGTTLWELSEPGTVSFPGGLTRFEAAPDGRHRYLEEKAPTTRVEQVIEDLMVQPPR